MSDVSNGMDEGEQNEPNPDKMEVFLVSQKPFRGTGITPVLYESILV